MLIKLYDENPNPRHVDQVVDILRVGGLVVFPTDTVYAMGCDIYQPKAVERLAWLKDVKIEKADFSFVFSDISQLSEFTKNLSNQNFKILKQYLPGPFTFILDASNKVPRIFKNRKKTIGIRIPDNNIIREIVRFLGNPVIVTSVHDEDEVLDYTTDPELINEKYQNNIDVVVDGGYGKNEASTVIDLTGEEPLLVRQGIGELE